MKCPNCQNENKSANIRCEYCGTQLIDVQDHLNDSNKIIVTFNGTTQTYKQESKTIEENIKGVKTTGCITNIIILFITGPFLLIGFVLLLVGVLATIEEYKTIENYVETEAKLIAFGNCYSNEEQLCSGIYQFEVNGIEYTASPNKSTNEDNFKETEKVYYNPSNPSENLIRAGWTEFIIIGGVLFSAVITVFIIKSLIQKSIIKNIKNNYQSQRIS